MKFLLAIFLLLPVISHADYSEESYFLTGKLYDSEGQLLRNKEILLVTGNRYFVFFTTNSDGNYKVEVPYLIPCLSGPAGRTRLDDRAMEEAKYYNSDTIKFYYGEQYASYTNFWHDYYSKDTSCKRFFCYHGPEKKSDCLTKKADIVLHQHPNSNKLQAVFRQEIDDEISKINKVCFISEDSVRFLGQYRRLRREYNYNFKKQYDSLTLLGKGGELKYTRYEESHPLSDSMQKIQMILYNLEYEINHLFGRFQLLNRKISALNESLGLCNRLFALDYDARKNEYQMHSDLFLNNYFVLKVKKDGTITDFYDFERSEEYK